VTLAASPETPAFPDDAVEVARIVGAWGVKGGIKLKPLARDPQALFSSKRWFLRPAEPPRPGAAAPPLLRVRQAREHGEHIVAACEGLDDRDAAEQLTGARVFVSRASFPSTADDEYYWVDLIGLAVHNRQGDMLGHVSGLLETGAQSVLCIDPGEGRPEILIPFVAAYVDSVERDAKLIRVDWQREYG
jgi:16S rRNA processing protein RimM